MHSIEYATEYFVMQYWTCFIKPFTNMTKPLLILTALFSASTLLLWLILHYCTHIYTYISSFPNFVLCLFMNS